MAQSTFLQLCQRTSRKCRVHHASVELPTAVTGQTGEMLRIVEAVSEAWFQIQARRDDWRFKRQETSFVTVDGQAEYTTLQCGDIGRAHV